MLSRKRRRTTDAAHSEVSRILLAFYCGMAITIGWVFIVGLLDMADANDRRRQLEALAVKLELARRQAARAARAAEAAPVEEVQQDEAASLR